MGSNKTVSGAKGKGSTAYTIPASKLAETRTLQVKYGITQDDILALAQQISEAGGQLEPAMIRLDASGQPVIWSGCTRRLALMEINKDPAKWGFGEPLDLVCNLRELPEGEPTWLAAFQSNTLKPMSTMDLAKIVSTFKDAHGWNTKQIVAKLRGPNVKLSQPKCDTLVAIMRLPQSVHEMIHQGFLKESHAKAIIALAKAAKLEDGEVFELANHMVAKLTFKDYLSAVKSIMSADSLKNLASMVIDADAADDCITAKTIGEVVNRKKRDEGASIKRDVSDLLKICKVVDTQQTKLIAKWIEGEGEDLELIRLFRQLSEVED